MKAIIRDEMCNRHIHKAELARMMALGPKQIDRILDSEQNTKAETLEEVLAVLGLRITVTITRVED
jgi:DNA-binding phage protein